MPFLRAVAVAALLPLITVGVGTSQAEAAGTTRVGTAAVAGTDSTGTTWAAARGFAGGHRAGVSAGVSKISFARRVTSTRLAASVARQARTSRSVTPVVLNAPVVASSSRPSAVNTGVPAGTVLRPHYGNLVITTPGATYDAMDIHGFVTIKAPNVKMTRSIIRGGVATGNIGLITNYTTTATNFRLEDSELVPAFPSTWIDGIKGTNFHIRRVNIHGTVDAVKVHGDNVTVEDSWLHDMRVFAADPNHGGRPTHNDGVQVLGGKNIRIRNNSISGASNAALQVTQDYSRTTDLEFTGNAVDGGTCTVNLDHKKLRSMSGVTVKNNSFGRSARCAFISTRATTISASGNVYADNGAAVSIYYPY